MIYAIFMHIYFVMIQNHYINSQLYNHPLFRLKGNHSKTVAI